MDRNGRRNIQSSQIMLSHALVVQPPDWSQPFHIFIDASDMAIGSVLMQMTPPNWYQPVYYASSCLSVADKNYSPAEREELGMIYKHNQVSALSSQSEIFVPCLSLGPLILGHHTVIVWKIGKMVATLIGIRIRHPASTRSATCHCRLP